MRTWSLLPLAWVAVPGTGGAPIVAQVAREMGILTVAVVTKPFPFEGRRRLEVALRGIEELGQHVDSLITIPNEKLLSVLGRQMTLLEAFRVANDVLRGAVQGIAELITRPGSDQRRLCRCPYGHVGDGYGDDGHRCVER